MVWAGARLGKGRAALGPEGGSPVSTRAQCLKRSSISGTTPRQPRQPLCGCSFYSSSLQSHGYLAHFMIGDTYSRSHCRTGIETQVCQPHSLRQSPPSQCPPHSPRRGFLCFWFGGSQMAISVGPSASRGGCHHHRHKGWVPTLSQRCASTTGLPIGARRKPFGTSWPWTRTVGHHQGQAQALRCPPTARLACPHLLSPPVRSTVSALRVADLGQWMEGTWG